MTTPSSAHGPGTSGDAPSHLHDGVPGGSLSGATSTSGPNGPTAPRGPHAPTLALSVIGLVVAALVLVVDIAHPDVDPVRAMPWALLATGVVLVVCGVPGIVARRRGHASDG